MRFLPSSRQAASTARSLSCTSLWLRDRFTECSRSTWSCATFSSIFSVGMGSLLSALNELTPTILRSPVSTSRWNWYALSAISRCG